VRTDEDLARAFGAGDDGALAALYELYRRPPFVFCARMLGHGEEARDVVQDVFAGAFGRRQEFAGLRSPRAWLFTVARNRCLSVMRRGASHARLAPAVSGATGPEAPPDALEAADDARRVRRALAELAPEQREVVVLREYQDLSYREIAEITQSTEGAVKSKLFRARQALCERLAPRPSEGDTP